MLEIMPKILVITENWDRWSEMVGVELPDITITYYNTESITFENILSIRVLEWPVILIGCKITGINNLEARETKKSFFWLCSL